MTEFQMLLTILIAAVMTIFTRGVSFIAFRNGHTPVFITWMGRQLPPAVMAMLLVYCLKDVNPTVTPFGIPAFLGVAVTAAMHLWKKQIILSISSGTVAYMLLLRLFG